MSEVTIDKLVLMQAELAALIERFRQQRATTTLQIAATEIPLLPGEWYAGAVLNEDGSVKHHLIVAAVNDAALDFDDTQPWAKAKGYSAPTRQESPLIVAHRYSRLAGMSWFWTCEENGSSDAWCCYLDYGYVDDGDRGAEGGAVAVRRLVP